VDTGATVRSEKNVLDGLVGLEGFEPSTN
jgi:hypothetical protein